MNITPLSHGEVKQSKHTKNPSLIKVRTWHRKKNNKTENYYIKTYNLYRGIHMMVESKNGGT